MAITAATVATALVVLLLALSLLVAFSPWPTLGASPENSTEDTSLDALPGHETFPVSWGDPPVSPPTDAEVVLPGGYGKGPTTLAAWIQKKLDAEVKEREAEAEKGIFSVAPGEQTREIEVLPHLKLDGCEQTSDIPTRRVDGVDVESGRYYRLGDCTRGSARADLRQVAQAEGYGEGGEGGDIGDIYVSRIYVRYQGAKRHGFENDATVVYVNGYPVMRVHNRYNLSYEKGYKATKYNAEVRVLLQPQKNPSIELRSASKSDSREDHMKITSLKLLCSDTEAALNKYTLLQTTAEGLGIGTERLVDLSEDRSTLPSGKDLHFNEMLFSVNASDGRYAAYVNDMGQLVVSNSFGAVLWTNRKPDVTLTRTHVFVHPKTGKLVQMNGNELVWTNKTSATAGAVLKVNGDGNLTVEKDGVVYWASDTSHKRKATVGQAIRLRAQKKCPYKVAGRWDDAGGIRCCPTKHWQAHGNTKGYCKNIPDGGECVADSQCESGKCHDRSYGRCPNGKDCEPRNSCAQRK